ncbi:PIN domain-containing protein [Mycolicibacterium iranicum]|uniref:PIN domain-containing protein n=1 Tax=Mycolicibacterium iranicum TaxID=912594 RepID=A0ABT4HKY4_MYCIR|nr:PIN domain-containing protein [Mycolicibacterium iranicum]MCZ0730481.1 PIN domain-containing protein [Mycolicibacterium iranicum]
MLHLLIDTSIWLDIVKRRDGFQLLAGINAVTIDFQDEGIPRLNLLVPQLVIDEFERNRPKVEASMTSEVAQRFKLIRRDVATYGSESDDGAMEMLDRLAHQVPLIGAMAARSFDHLAEMLTFAGTRVKPTARDRDGVVQRGLSKLAPFHRNKNNVADALLIEMYASQLAKAGPDDRFGFVTSNSEDFSAVGGDNREPHSDLAPLFAGENSSYLLGVEPLISLLLSEFEGLKYIITPHDDFEGDEPRGLDEILAAEREMFDRIWYDRSLHHEQEALNDGNKAEAKRIRQIARSARARVEEAYGVENLGPYDKFEWGMLNGKLSALRWVLGSEWDFLDT